MPKRLKKIPRLYFVQGKLIQCLDLEPMGSVAPKINANDELTMVRSRLQQNVTLLCPAQSYPVPVFRQFKKGNLSLKQYFLYNVLEPVDIAGPRLTSGDKTRIVDEMLNGSITLLCPSQAYPVPIFRTH
uniref:Uncharacterized protein n=1 Tax=Glossina pallidipes TaxID=7398 RepID=A0A1B0AGE9_GLOPL